MIQRALSPDLNEIATSQVQLQKRSNTQLTVAKRMQQQYQSINQPLTSYELEELRIKEMAQYRSIYIEDKKRIQGLTKSANST